MTQHFDGGGTVTSLHERNLIHLAPEDSGWVRARANLSNSAREDLRVLLAKRTAAPDIKLALGRLEIAFADAVEAAIIERRLVLAAQRSTEAKKPSRKLGVLLRSRIKAVLSALERSDKQPGEICEMVLAEPILERLVTPLVEEQLCGSVCDPLRRAPETAIKALPEILAVLNNAIDTGISTGKVEASHDLLAQAVVSVIARSTGVAPKRNWNAYAGTETGHGLECCRLLARELNLALPEDMRRDEPLDMAKAWRRATEAAAKAA